MSNEVQQPPSRSDNSSNWLFRSFRNSKIFIVSLVLILLALLLLVLTVYTLYEGNYSDFNIVTEISLALATTLFSTGLISMSMDFYFKNDSERIIDNSLKQTLSEYTLNVDSAISNAIVQSQFILNNRSYDSLYSLHDDIIKKLVEPNSYEYRRISRIIGEARQNVRPLITDSLSISIEFDLITAKPETKEFSGLSSAAGHLSVNVECLYKINLTDIETFYNKIQVHKSNADASNNSSNSLIVNNDGIIVSSYDCEPHLVDNADHAIASNLKVDNQNIYAKKNDHYDYDFDLSDKSAERELYNNFSFFINKTINCLTIDINSRSKNLILYIDFNRVMKNTNVFVLRDHDIKHRITPVDNSIYSTKKTISFDTVNNGNEKIIILWSNI